MNAIWITRYSPLWYVIMLPALILVIGWLAMLIRCILARRSRRILLCAGIHLSAAFILFLILMDCARFAYLSEPDLRYQPFQMTLFGLPWILYMGLEMILSIALGLLVRDDIRYRRNHLTPDTIRETVNLLPEGICISAQNGTVLLSNLQMNNLCRILTGGSLSDGVRFRKYLEETGEEQNGEILIHAPDGKVWRVNRNRITESGKEYDRLTAADITEQYRVTEELRNNNEHLQDLQKRMKAVSDLSGDMFIGQEEANARSALHNQLGQVLLMDRHYLEHPESTDADMVGMATREMNRFLLGDAEAPFSGRTDRLRQAVALAQSIGVQAEIHGMVPEHPAYRALLAQAVQECAANTVKHAEGDRIDLFPEETGKEWTVRITNNGCSPKGPIAESGGLLSLRRNVESAGGSMTVRSTPVFELVFRIPTV